MQLSPLVAGWAQEKQDRVQNGRAAMKVNFHTIRGYLSWLTEGRGASDPSAGDDWELYEADMDAMIAEARARGDEAILRLVIASLAAAPDGRVRPFFGQARSWNDESLAGLLAHAHRYLWQEDAPVRTGDGPQPEIVPMSDEEWARRRKQGQVE
jgi:uncharacterized damage-inducible protein DinB